MKPILFCDFNGVISYDPFWKEIREPSHNLHKFHQHIQDYLFKQNPSLINDWMLGKYTSEDIHKILDEETGVPFEPLWEVFVKGCEQIDISISILNSIQALKSKYYTILATGNMDCFDRFTVPANPKLNQAFDEINNSYNIGIFKSTENGRYFTEKASSLNVEIRDCVVIDDSSKVCRIFESLGGKACCVTGEEYVLKALDSLG